MTMRNWTARLAQRLGRSRKLRTASASAAILAGGMMFAGSASAATLFSENFDGLALGPFVSTSESGGDGTDWTDVPPAGWVRDNTTTPVGGPVEFFGFTFMDVDSWAATEGQSRNSFVKGGIGSHGTVMVADGDGYDDDAGNGNVLGENQSFNAFIRTQPISLTGVPANNVLLQFDSSFRPYQVMEGTVDVSFDGGANYTNLLTLNGTNSGGDSSLQRANESVSLDVPNPSGGNMLVRFGMTKMDNDWWWALDNIRVVTSEADVNGDGSIDLADFDIIRANFYEGTTLEQGDVNQDGIVNEIDFRIWKDAFGGGGPNAVPEPSTLALLASASLGAMALLRRRTR